MTLSGFLSVFVITTAVFPSLFFEKALATSKRVVATDAAELDLDQDNELSFDESQNETKSSEANQKSTPQRMKKNMTKNTVQPVISNKNTEGDFAPIDDNGQIADKAPSQNALVPSRAQNTPELQRARKAFQDKKYSEAESLFWKNIEKLSLADMKMMMYASDRQGKTIEAIKAAQLILGKTRGDADAYTMIGKSHAEKTTQKDSEKLAIENLKKAIEVNPKFEPAYLAFAAFYEKKIKILEGKMQNKKRSYYELRLLYQEMSEQFPKKPQYASLVCKIDALDEQLDQAKESCRKAMLVNPKDPMGYVYMGIAYQKAKEDDEAKRLLSGAVKRFKNSDLASLSWAQYLESQGNFVDAYNFFKSATTLSQQNVDAWTGVARTAMQIGKEEDSYQAFKKACGLNSRAAGVALRKSYGYAKTMRAQFELLEESCH